MMNQTRIDIHAVDRRANLVRSLSLWLAMLGVGAVCAYFKVPEKDSRVFCFFFGPAFLVMVITYFLHWRAKRTLRYLVLSLYFPSFFLLKEVIPFIWVVFLLALLFVLLLFSSLSRWTWIKDTNLFLKLIQSESEEGITERPERLSRADFRRFCTFLGRRGVVTDYMSQVGRWVLYMPITGFSWTDILLPLDRWRDNSIIVVTPDGGIQARLSNKDEKHMKQKLNLDFDAETLERAVSQKLLKSFSLLMEGEEALAAEVLGISEKEVDSTSRSRATTAGIIAILAIMFLFLLVLVVFIEWL